MEQIYRPDLSCPNPEKRIKLEAHSFISQVKNVLNIDERKAIITKRTFASSHAPCISGEGVAAWPL